MDKQIQPQSDSIPVISEPPVPLAPQTKYAGFWVRFAAYLFDALIVSAAIDLLQLLFGFAGISIAPFNLGFFVAMLVGIVAAGFYYIFLTYKYQATFGKMILGLKVFSANLERPSLGRIFVREIPAKVISGAILYIGFIMAGFNKRKQALHDKVAKTVVVYRDPNKSVTANAALVALFSVSASIALGSLYSKIIQPSPKSLNPASISIIDQIINTDVSSASRELDDYFMNHGTYSGFSIENTAMKDYAMDFKKVMSENKLPCQSYLKIDISPDGTKFVVHQPLCSNPQKSACFETDSTDPAISDTAKIEKNYSCK
jgi:uncharacterized RDD family membrane protein YckC